MFRSCWSLMLIAATAFAAESGEGRVVGRVIDEACAPAGGAVVRLLPEKGGRAVSSAEAAADGRFAMERLKPGAYTLRVSWDGFYERRVYRLAVSAGRTADVGSVALVTMDCDAPGAHCQYRCDPSDDPAACNDPVLKKGRLLIKPGCGADFEAGSTLCDNAAKADVILKPGERGSLYLQPANGALITTADSGVTGFSDKAIRIDGFWTGAGFWVRTGAGQAYVHLIVMADLEPDAAGLDVIYLNRRHEPRLTPTSGSCRIGLPAR